MLNILALQGVRGHRLGVMSARGGMPARLQRVLFIVVACSVVLTGCEYAGPEEQGMPPSPQAATPPPKSFEDNAGEVVRQLEASRSEPGMPTEEEPAGKLSVVLGPGDYLVSGACAGVYDAKLIIEKADVLQEASEFRCGQALDRFVRHDGGPLTISAVPRTGKPSATGVKVQTNPDPRASELADLSEWASQQLRPFVPGEQRGSSGTNSSTGVTLMAEPGRYDLQFVCAEAPWAELSVQTSAGAEVLAPVRVPCDGEPVTTPVELPTQGADLTMRPVDGPKGRFAYRLVPEGRLTPAG